MAQVHKKRTTRHGGLASPWGLLRLSLRLKKQQVPNRQIRCKPGFVSSKLRVPLLLFVAADVTRSKPEGTKEPDFPDREGPGVRFGHSCTLGDLRNDTPKKGKTQHIVILGTNRGQFHLRSFIGPRFANYCFGDSP